MGRVGKVVSNIDAVEQAARETGHVAEQISESATDRSKQADFLREVHVARDMPMAAE